MSIECPLRRYATISAVLCGVVWGGSTPNSYASTNALVKTPEILGVPMAAIDNPKPVWDAIGKKVEKASHVWNQHNFSISGRIPVCNNFFFLYRI